MRCHVVHCADSEPVGSFIGIARNLCVVESVYSMRSSCTYCTTALAPINSANVFTLEVNCPAQAEQAGITEIDQPPPATQRSKADTTVQCTAPAARVCCTALQIPLAGAVIAGAAAPRPTPAPALSVAACRSTRIRARGGGSSVHRSPPPRTTSAPRALP
jgi:hypothetical protein